MERLLIIIIIVIIYDTIGIGSIEKSYYTSRARSHYRLEYS